MHPYLQFASLWVIQKTCVKRLLMLQQDDGGWALASVGDWSRSDGKEQDLETSDGPGFVNFIAHAGTATAVLVLSACDQLR